MLLSDYKPVFVCAFSNPLKYANLHWLHLFEISPLCVYCALSHISHLNSPPLTTTQLHDNETDTKLFQNPDTCFLTRRFAFLLNFWDNPDGQQSVQWRLSSASRGSVLFHSCRSFSCSRSRCCTGWMTLRHMSTFRHSLKTKQLSVFPPLSRNVISGRKKQDKCVFLQILFKFMLKLGMNNKQKEFANS